MYATNTKLLANVSTDILEGENELKSLIHKTEIQLGQAMLVKDDEKIKEHQLRLASLRNELDNFTIIGGLNGGPFPEILAIFFSFQTKYDI